MVLADKPTRDVRDVPRKNDSQGTSRGLSLDKNPGTLHKYVLNVWCLLEDALFTGLTFGWPLLVILLKADGVYGDLCENDAFYNTSLSLDNSSQRQGTTSCVEQDEQLNLAFTVASSFPAVALPVFGQLLYRWGVRISRIVTALILSAALLMMAFVSREIPWLLFPGLTFLATAGYSLYCINVQAAYLFGPRSSIIVSLQNGMFQISTSMALLLKYLYDQGISLKNIFLGSCGLLLLLSSVNTIFLSPKTFFTEPPSLKETSECSKDPPAEHTATVPSLKESALAPTFISNAMWFGLLQLQYFFFLGSFNTWVIDLTDGSDEDTEFYTDVNMYVGFGGPALCLLSGFCQTLDRQRCADRATGAGRRLKPALITQTVGSVLAIVLPSVILVHSTRVLVFLFVVVIGHRTILYFMSAAFIQMIFPVQHFGFLYGVMGLIGGIVGCLQYPLFMWVEEEPVGVQKVNIFLLVLMVATLVHPLNIWITCRRAEKKYADGDKTQSQDYGFISSKTN